jgi:hypothetical protein
VGRNHALAAGALRGFPRRARFMRRDAVGEVVNMGDRTVQLISSLILIALSPSAAFVQQEPPRGFEIVDITRDPDVLHAPRDLNNCGQAVYTARFTPSWASADVFLYDNGRVTRITENDDRDVISGITENGIIYWGRGEGDDGTTQFLARMNGEEILLVDSPTGVPVRSMNSRGHYVWGEWMNTGCSNADIALVFYDGEGLQVLRAGGSSPSGARLNELDEITWMELDFCEEPLGYDVVFYRDGVFTTITEDGESGSNPVLNNRSQVAYSSWPQQFGGPSETKLWENGTSRTIIDPPQGGPWINDLGDVTFERVYPEGSEYKQVWMYHADTEELAPLTANDFHQAAWAMNDYREVLIASLEFGDNRQVRLLRRIRTGDSEFDGDIDHDDLAKLVDCMTGPMWVERTDPGPEESLCECRFLDIDHDGSVDLRDYAIFQQNFGG